MLAGGGTTWGVRSATPDLARDPPPDAVGGGGTGFGRKSPLAELPQLLRSRLTCDGGGATTAGAGSDILGVDDTSRGGAETGGATTSTVCVSGTRELAKSRCVSRGAGAMTVGAIGFAVGILSRGTFGAVGVVVVVRVCGVGGFLCWLAGGGVGLALSILIPGEAGTTLVAGRVGAVREERRPSAGGG